MQHCCPSFGTSKEDHNGGHSDKMFSQLSAGHHGAYHLVRLNRSHHGGVHMSHHSMSHHHGGSRFSHHRGFHSSHLAGGSHHGGSNLNNLGSSKLTHYGGGPHLKFHRASNLSHHKSYPESSHYRCPPRTHQRSSHHAGSSKVNFRESRKSHQGSCHGLHFSSHSSWKKDSLLNINEKETMQRLNGRLSCYLDKVSALMQENAQLESKICEWYANNAPTSLPDSSQYFRIISDLQNQIAAAAIENARIVLQIDNAKLTANDYRDKYEMERNMSKNTEADINAMCKVLEELNSETCGLEMQVQNHQDELQDMKKKYEKAVNCLRAQLGTRVNVELNAAPSIDLNRALAEIRDEYENLMEKNLREAENMFRKRTEDLNRQVMCGSEQLQCVRTEVIELHRMVQTLEIELQSQMKMTSVLESTLAETQATFACQLDQLQGMINNVECQLAQIRSDLECQNHEYKILMDQKTHLEKEIATYKCLLDGNDIQISELAMSNGKHGYHHKVVHQTCGHRH